MKKIIKEAEKLLSGVIDKANALFLYLDPLGNTVLCNKKIEDLSVRNKSGVIGKNWSGILYPDAVTQRNQQMLKAIIDDSITYKRPNNFEGMIIDKDKSQRLISWSITPIVSGSRKKLEGILLVGNDITELRSAEESLKKKDESLKNIFSEIKEYALYVANLEGNITYYGMGSEIMFGWRKKEIIFKHVSLLHTKEDAATRLTFILGQAVKQRQYETEIDLVKKDGTPFPVILTVNQFLDTQGQLSGYIFMAKDITERKKLEYQIFQAEKLAAIGQLAAGMAHEINNPLFVISGRLEMLLEQAQLPAELKEDLNIINTQADRIRKLVDRMLKFSRKTTPKLEPLDINDIIESVLPLLSYHKLPSAKIEIEKDLQKDLRPVRADLNQLQEVFINLFINACQSMPQGGRLSIDTRDLDNEFAQVKISDTGVGIAPQYLKNIFMPFFSTKKDGTGLGLSICYNIIKNHNGSIDIYSRLNQGTTFTIKIPFA